MALPQNPPQFTAVVTGSKEYSIEVNDAVFETQAWKLPRYEGCQLFTTELNKVSTTTISGSGSVAGKKYVGPIDENGGTGSIQVPDKTGVGHTACVQKYSRNIYIGNAVIGMDDGGEDRTLVNFTNFSYVQTNKSLTINDDGSVTVNELETSKTNNDSKIGFYRSFYEDFSIGTDCRVILLDNTIKSNLSNSYPVYFNGGQLQKLIRFDISVGPIGALGTPIDGEYAQYSGSYYMNKDNSSSLFEYARQSGIISASVAVFNRDNIINQFFTGSLFENVTLYTTPPDIDTRR